MTSAATTPVSGPLAERVRSLFDAFLAGDLDTPVTAWRDDATYVAVTPPDGLQTFTKRQYWEEFLPAAIGQMPGYALAVVDVEAFGPLVVVHLRSTWDTGGAEGIMVFRVANDEVVEVWAINADGRDASTYF